MTDPSQAGKSLATIAQSGPPRCEYSGRRGQIVTRYDIAPCSQARSLRGYDIARRAHSRRSRLIPASLTAAAAATSVRTNQR